jgi:hypothetical protein
LECWRQVAKELGSFSEAFNDSAWQTVIVENIRGLDKDVFRRDAEGGLQIV